MDNHNFRLAIRGIGVVSPLGHDFASHIQAHSVAIPAIVRNDRAISCAPLHTNAETILQALLESHPKYKYLDRTALLAILASQQAFGAAGWSQEQSITVNIGSSRGATSTWEEQHSLYTSGKAISPRTSPLT